MFSPVQFLSCSSHLFELYLLPVKTCQNPVHSLIWSIICSSCWLTVECVEDPGGGSVRGGALHGDDQAGGGRGHRARHGLHLPQPHQIREQIYAYLMNSAGSLKLKTTKTHCKSILEII